MANKTFTIGETLKIEASEHVRYNGVDGIIWTKRVKCADGSGWVHDGNIFLPTKATRRAIVESFGLVYLADLINA